MKKQATYVPYGKASKNEQKKRDSLKRSTIDIPVNKVHESIKDYDRNNEHDIIKQVTDELGYDE